MQLLPCCDLSPGRCSSLGKKGQSSLGGLGCMHISDSLALFLQALCTSRIPVPLFLLSIQLKNLKFMLFQAPLLLLLKESKFKYNTLFELK